MMKGIIVKNGYYDSPSAVNQAERMASELRSLGAEVSIVKNDLPYYIGEDYDIDFAVFFDKDINLARNMEEKGVLVFNSSFSIENTDDKNRMALVLERAKIVTPMTVPAPRRYSYDGADIEYLNKVAERLGFPLVVKEAKGSLGEQVYLAHDLEELKSIDEKIGNKEKLYQQFVSESEGSSVRVIVVGKKYLCAMLLTNENDFRSNVHNGGIGVAVDLDESFVTTAESVADAFDLDYCGVDFFSVAPIVIEVNSNAYFEGIEKATGSNVAKKYAEYIIERIEEYKKCKNSLN